MKQTPIVELLRRAKQSDGWRTYSEKPDDPMAGSHMHGDLMERAADRIEEVERQFAEAQQEQSADAQSWRRTAEKLERKRLELERQLTNTQTRVEALEKLTITHDLSDQALFELLKEGEKLGNAAREQMLRLDQAQNDMAAVMLKRLSDGEEGE